MRLGHFQNFYTFFEMAGTFPPALGTTAADITGYFIMRTTRRQPAIPPMNDGQFDIHGLSGIRI